MQTDTIQTIPLTQIKSDALARDRVSLDGPAMEELQMSILSNGLRQPIEVFELREPDGDQIYGLISGFRRHGAFVHLHQDMGFEKFRNIPAIVREPADLGAAMAAMVEENAIRAEISPYERSRIAVVAVERGIFQTIDQAIDTLYHSAHPTKRSRIRAMTLLCEELDGCFSEPEALSQRQAMRIVAALQLNFGDLMRQTLRDNPNRSPEAQWEAILPMLAEAERERSDTFPVPRPGRPRRLLKMELKRVTIRRELARDGWMLHFTGPDATSSFMDDVVDEVERMWGPR